MSTYHYTLNPADKYVNPAAPIPPTPYKSKISTASADDLVEHNHFERVHPVALETVNEVSTVGCSSRRASSSCYDLPLHTFDASPPRSEPISRQSSIWATFGEARGVRSAGHAPRMGFDFGFERPSTSTGDPMEFIDRISLASAPGRPISEPHALVFEPSTVGEDFGHVYEPIRFPEEIPEVECFSDKEARSANVCLSESRQPRGPTSEFLSVLEKSRPSPKQVNDLASQFSLTLVAGKLRDSAQFNRLDTELSSNQLETGDRSGKPGGLPDDATGLAQEKNHQTSSVYSSVRSSQIVSPSLTFSTALTGYMSPVHLGQPSTPMIDEFEELFLDLKLDSFLARCDEQPEADNATPHANSSGFPGYSLPEVEYKSALTVHNLQSTTPKDSPSKNKSSHDLVSSWNDGLVAQETGFEELLDELGYLGEVIV